MRNILQKTKDFCINQNAKITTGLITAMPLLAFADDTNAADTKTAIIAFIAGVILISGGMLALRASIKGSKSLRGAL